MPNNFKKHDLRVIKTYKSLLLALSKLLGTKNFSRLTVNDLCEEAQLSRTAFYMHFLDKYDLLKYFLNEIKPKIHMHISDNVFINELFIKNRRGIVNLVEDADYLTMEILQEFLLSVADIPHISKNTKHKNIVLANFCAGGIIQNVIWQIKNNFPTDLQMINIYIEEIIHLLRKWEVDNEK